MPDLISTTVYSNRNTLTPEGSSWRLPVAGTISHVIKYRLTREMLDHVRDIVRDEIATRFTSPPPKGGQKAIAKQLHISQPTLSQCLLSTKRDFGIGVILGIHAYFAENHRPRTLDEMLGLGTATLGRSPDAASARRTEERLHVIEAELARLEEARVKAVSVAAQTAAPQDRSRIRRK